MYIFDTDHISLYGRDFPAIVERVAFTRTSLITTVVTVEEQIRGRIKQLAETKTDATRSQAYEWLTSNVYPSLRAKVRSHLRRDQKEKSRVVMRRPLTCALMFIVFLAWISPKLMDWKL